MRTATIVFASLPFALIGGIVAVWLTGGVLSLGSLVGFVTVLGIAARNGIMLVSHYRHLEQEEGMTFGRDLVLRGAEERLAPIAMTALVTRRARQLDDLESVPDAGGVYALRQAGGHRKG